MDAFLKESCTSGSISATDVSVCEVAESLVSRSHDIDIFYTLICGALVFFMQCGFAMLCAGSVRQKNVKNIMLKNLLDACGGALGFWSIGFALSYGTGGDFVGTSSGEYFLNDYDNYVFFFFQFTFSCHGCNNCRRDCGRTLPNGCLPVLLNHVDSFYLSSCCSRNLE